MLSYCLKCIWVLYKYGKRRSTRSKFSISSLNTHINLYVRNLIIKNTWLSPSGFGRSVCLFHTRHAAAGFCGYTWEEELPVVHFLVTCIETNGPQMILNETYHCCSCRGRSVAQRANPPLSHIQISDALCKQDVRRILSWGKKWISILALYLYNI